MNKFQIFLSAALCLLFLQAQSQGQILDKVIAKVGGEVVLYSELAEKLALMKEQRGGIPDEAPCLVLESLMGSALLVNQARLDSVLVSPVEVEAQMQARMDQILGMMGGDMQLFQEIYGQTVVEMKDQVRDDMENKILAERMQQNVLADISVTPSQVIAFYNQIPVDSIPYFDSEVELGEIVFFPEVNSVEKKIAYDKALEIKEKLKNGEDFGELAKTFSDDLGSARENGALGWNTRGSFVSEFEAAAFRLEADEISDIVESQFGYHIIQLIERRGNSINTRHILIKPKMTQADLDLAVRHLDSVRQLILADSMSFSQGVKKFSDERTQSYSNNGRMINPQTGNTFFQTRDVDSEIFFAIDTIEVGEITAPIEFRSQSGEPIYKLIQLQERTNPHKANLRQDYSKIQEAARESRKNAFFNDWIEKKIKSTYIELDPHFQSCPNISRWNLAAARS